LAVKAGIGENESLIVNISTRQIKVDEPVYGLLVDEKAKVVDIWLLF